MENDKKDLKIAEDMLYPMRRYRGELSPLKPEAIAFDANLQKFSQEISYIVAFETSGKITQEEAYGHIKKLFKQLKKSKKGLNITDL